MVFGMCVTRVIGFVVGFVKDVVVANKGVKGSNVKSEESINGPRFEELTTEEKKTK
jgi:hypothetical protein